MLYKILNKYPLTDLNIIGMVLFMLVFLGSIFWVTRKKNIPLIDYCSKLPFEEEKGLNDGRR